MQQVGRHDAARRARRRPAPRRVPRHRGGLLTEAISRSCPRARKCVTCSATGPKPAPRRRSPMHADPRSDERRRLVADGHPRRRGRGTASRRRGGGGRGRRRSRAPHGTVYRRRRATRRDRSPPSSRRRPPPPCARAERRRRHHPREPRPAPASPDRPSRTAAPCPPAGHGCRPSGSPLSVVSRPVRLPTGGRPCPVPAPRRPGSSSAAASKSRWHARRRGPRNRTPRSSTAPTPRRCAQVDAQPARSRQRLGHEVAVADRVERGWRTGGEAQASAGRRRVDRQRRSGQRPGTERGHVEPLDGDEQPVDVAGERPPVGEQVVGEEDGLGPLGVGVAGQVGVAGVDGRQGARPANRRRAGDLDELALAPQPQIGRDLVVAAPCGVHLGARRPGQLGDPALDRRVDVLVGWHEVERAVGELGSTSSRARRIRATSRRRGARLVRGRDVGARSGDVVGQSRRSNGRLTV